MNTTPPNGNPGELGLQVAQSAPTIRGDEFWHVGVSGGKDSSAALLYMVKDSGIPQERILASWCDIGNDHEATKAHVAWLASNIHPIETIYPEIGFFDLAMSRHRFPSTCARFCTEELKIIPTAEHLLRLRLSGKRIISVSGVRADESADRAGLPEWDFSGNLFCWNWRPLLNWTTQAVFDYHAHHGVPLNPLYALGAQRVGCWPCVMSRKEEIRIIALKNPDRIDQIETMESEFVKRYGRFSSFFPATMVPERFRSLPITTADGRRMNIATIRDVVKWSMTGKRAQGHWADSEPSPRSCNSGYCE